MKTTVEKPKTQLQRAKAIRERYERWAPIISELADDLGKLLDETPDGTINAVGDDQLLLLAQTTRDLLRRIKVVAVAK